jgi:homoserine O-succinyltransferase/O-acetyltransferase
MPLTLERPSGAPTHLGELSERRQRRGSMRDRSDRITIGLVNNMPDSALAATERQFSRLLEASASGYDVRLRLYALEATPRSRETKLAMQANYHSVRALRAETPDALIITGAEPRAASLVDEPYWREMAELFDLARARTRSTVFSCLAAHAAVLHWDGVARLRMARKLSGVYTARVVERHRLIEDFPAEIATPHSRYNGLDETALAENGYATLVRSAEAGAHLFVKEAGSLLIFLQGHPEYDADTLAREFRRDLTRFLNGERPAPPDLPENYFAAPLRGELEALVALARRGPSPELVARFPVAALTEASDAHWRGHSVRLYRNWLALVAERKAALRPPFAAARWGG